MVPKEGDEKPLISQEERHVAESLMMAKRASEVPDRVSGPGAGWNYPFMQNPQKN